MRNRLLILFPLILLTSLFSCRTSRPLASSSHSIPHTTPHSASSSTFKPDLSIQEYINSYKGLAVTEMNRTGIPASITLAQGIIESDCGHSSLAREANNHFGIKCHDNWNGPVMRHTDNIRNECFRKYGKAEDSFSDHSDFLKSVPRYSFLFELNPTDYKAWAYGLKKAGYATNPDYANMLIRTIEENELWHFDRGIQAINPMPPKTGAVNEPFTIQDVDSSKKKVATASVNMTVMARVPRVMENNRIQYIIVKDGDTREKLENEFQLLGWELSKYNELKNDFSLVPGQILYLQPKRDKAEPGKEYYTVAEGDTMYLISQKYGIKLRKLYEMNRMEEGIEPEPGQKIWLRSMRPVN